MYLSILLIFWFCKKINALKDIILVRCLILFLRQQNCNFFPIGDGIITCDEYVRHSSSPHNIALGVLNQFNGGDCKLTHDEGLVPYHHMDGNGKCLLILFVSAK